MEEPLLAQEEIEEQLTTSNNGNSSNYHDDEHIMTVIASRGDQGGDQEGGEVLSSSVAAVAAISPGRQGLLLQAIFGILGVGVLVPWNAFISTKAYFVSRFCLESGDLVDVHIESKFALVYNLSAIAWLGSIILLQYCRDQRVAEEEEHHVSTAESGAGSPTPSLNNSINNNNEAGETDSERSSKSDGSTHSFWLVLVPLGMYVAVFVAQSAMVLYVDMSPETYRTFTFLGMALCGMCGITATSGILATAGLFPSHISTGPFLAGQSFGGVGVSLANFMAALWEDPDDFWNVHCDSKGDNNNNTISTVLRQDDDAPETCVPYQHADMAVFGYFAAASIVLFCSLCGYLYIDHYQRQRHRDRYETVDDLPPEAAQALTATTNETTGFDSSPRLGLEMNETTDPTRTTNNNVPQPSDSVFVDEPVVFEPHIDHHHHHEHNHSLHELSHIDSHNETTEVFAIVRAPALCIYLVFVVTLALFPGWISELRSTQRCRVHNRLDNDLYTPMAFVLFNVCDLGGRLLAGWVPVHRIRNLPGKLVTGALSRFMLFPLLALCVGGVVKDRVAIASNLYSFLVQVVFGTSNGFLVTLAFIYAPTVLPSITHVQERSSEILNLSLSLGLLSGSFLSFPVSQFLR